jgi:hypothetical protein
VKLGDSWEMLVCRADVGLEFLQSQASNRQHWTRSALSTYNFVLNNARLHRSDREGLLASQTGIEEPFDGFVGVVGEFFEGAQCCNDDSRDNTLGVAHSSRKSTTKFTRGQLSDVTNDQVLNQLGKPVKRE